MSIFVFDNIRNVDTCVKSMFSAHTVKPRLSSFWSWLVSGTVIKPQTRIAHIEPWSAA
jgi:hypothetical protein